MAAIMTEIINTRGSLRPKAAGICPNFDQISPAAILSASVLFGCGQTFDFNARRPGAVLEPGVVPEFVVIPESAVVPEFDVIPESAVVPEFAVIPESAVVPEFAVIPESAAPNPAIAEMSQELKIAMNGPDTVVLGIEAAKG